MPHRRVRRVSLEYKTEANTPHTKWVAVFRPFLAIYSNHDLNSEIQQSKQEQQLVAIAGTAQQIFAQRNNSISELSFYLKLSIYGITIKFITKQY